MKSQKRKREKKKDEIAGKNGEDEIKEDDESQKKEIWKVKPGIFKKWLILWALLYRP